MLGDWLRRCAAVVARGASLTTVRQPMEAMGSLAVNVIMEGINAKLEKREVNIGDTRSIRNW